MSNHDLAAQARHLAANAQPGTLARKAAGCVAVALHHSRSLDGARRVLRREVRLDDVRDAAEELLNELTAEPAATIQNPDS